MFERRRLLLQYLGGAEVEAERVVEAVDGLLVEAALGEEEPAVVPRLPEPGVDLDGPLGVLLNDEEAARDLQGILDNADQLVADARQGKGVLGRLMQDEALAAQFGDVVRNLDDVLRKANDPDAGVLGALTSDPQAAADLKVTLGNLRTVSDQLTQQKGLIGALINDEDMAIRFRRILNQVSRAIEDAREAAPISNFVQVLLGTF